MMGAEEWARDNAIHRIHAGSRLYGTERPDSDWDERGVCMMPDVSLIGLTEFEQYNHHDAEEDVVIYGLTKFFKLALQCNPNILELLFAPPETWLCETEEWWKIYERRGLFLSQRIRYTFAGYARSQLKRLQRHYQWLQNPPNHQPTAREYDGWLESSEKGGQKLIFPHLDAENRYKRASKIWKQYQTWLRERNPARAKLEAQFGYDTKHACNLVRMLLQGRELLRKGSFTPRLSDKRRATVLDVLGGRWEYLDLLAWAEKMDDELKTWTTCLPEHPDRNAVEVLLMKLNLLSLKLTPGLDCTHDHRIGIH